MCALPTQLKAKNIVRTLFAKYVKIYYFIKFFRNTFYFIFLFEYDFNGFSNQMRIYFSEILQDNLTRIYGPD